MLFFQSADVLAGQLGNIVNVSVNCLLIDYLLFPVRKLGFQFPRFLWLVPRYVPLWLPRSNPCVRSKWRQLNLPGLLLKRWHHNFFLLPLTCFPLFRIESQVCLIIHRIPLFRHGGVFHQRTRKVLLVSLIFLLHLGRLPRRPFRDGFAGLK